MSTVVQITVLHVTGRRRQCFGAPVRNWENVVIIGDIIKVFSQQFWLLDSWALLLMIEQTLTGISIFFQLCDCDAGFIEIVAVVTVVFLAFCLGSD